jgi:hypothetical protein
VYVFLSRVLFFFFFWLGLPYLGLLGVLILSPQQLTATPEAAAVSTRVLDNQHACFIVSSSSRLRPSVLFSSLLFHLALALTVSLSLSLSLPLLRPLLRARARASSAWETLKRVARLGGRLLLFLANSGNVATKGKTNAGEFYKELFWKNK